MTFLLIYYVPTRGNGVFSSMNNYTGRLYVDRWTGHWFFQEFKVQISGLTHDDEDVLAFLNLIVCWKMWTRLVYTLKSPTSTLTCVLADDSVRARLVQHQ